MHTSYACLYLHIHTHSPTHQVRFVDNYIADVITSLAVWLRDIDYAVQFYATGAFTDAKAEVELNKAYCLLI